MSVDKLLSAILKSAYTQAQAHRAVALLRSYLEQHFYNSDNQLDPQAYFLNLKLSPDDQLLIKGWPDEVYQFFKSPDLVYPTLHALTQALDSLPRLDLYLPFAPTPEGLIRYGSWLRKEIDEQLVIDIRLDPLTFGGCAVVWRGIRHDLSLSYWLLHGQTEVQQLIDHYARL